MVYGVTWRASDSQLIGQVTPNLHTNIVHAFETAPQLNAFVNTLSGTNIVAAHSLGNMVILSALNDYGNTNINAFFMIDAAVPIEALQSNASQSAYLIYPDWDEYANRLYATEWHSLFGTTDNRSILTWRNRLSDFSDAQIYNLYSSGEEVLRSYTNGAPPGELTGSAEAALEYLENQYLDTGLPAGCYTWCWQEMLKGRGLTDWIIGSIHGGWGFNANAPYYYMTNGILTHMSNSQATLLSNSVLVTNAFFDMSGDPTLFGSGGSAYAQTNLNRLLSDTFPALTLPVGANPVPGSGIVATNFDMQARFENGWPPERPELTTGAAAAGEWHHSDVRVVAYTFTHGLFDQIATSGNLK